MANKFYRTALAMMALVIVLLSTCNSCYKGKIARLENEWKGEVIKTVVKRDTTYKVDTFLKTAYVPKPYAVVRNSVIYHTRVDSFTAFETVPTDTAAILNDWLASRYYLDSGTTAYGKYYISDTVNRNRITGRSFRTNFSVPEITTTITNTVEKKKVKGYLALTIQGSYSNPVQAVGGGFMLQLKNDNAFEVQAFLNDAPHLPTQPFQLSFKHKLSFTKK
jgi:hypothetical protein